MTFIEDLSRKTWIYFIRTKDEVFSRFKELKAQVDNLKRKKIKVLRSDNGGEYTSNDLKDFRKEAGFQWEKTVSYNPKQIWGRNEKEQGHHQYCKGYDSRSGSAYVSLGRGMQHKNVFVEPKSMA